MKKMTAGQLVQIYTIATQQGCGEDEVQNLIESGLLADFFAGKWEGVSRDDFRKFAKLPSKNLGVKLVPELEQGVDTIIQIDRSVKLIYPDWMKEVENPELEGVGPTQYDMMTKVDLWLHDSQKGGVTTGHNIYEQLKTTDRLKNCFGYEDALAIQKNGIAAFRKVFGNKVVVCWRSVVRRHSGSLSVPYVCDVGDEVAVRWFRLDGSFDSNFPAGCFT